MLSFFLAPINGNFNPINIFAANFFMFNHHHHLLYRDHRRHNRVNPCIIMHSIEPLSKMIWKYDYECVHDFNHCFALSRFSLDMGLQTKTFGIWVSVRFVFMLDRFQVRGEFSLFCNLHSQVRILCVRRVYIVFIRWAAKNGQNDGPINRNLYFSDGIRAIARLIRVWCVSVHLP